MRNFVVNGPVLALVWVGCTPSETPSPAEAPPSSSSVPESETEPTRTTDSGTVATAQTGDTATGDTATGGTTTAPPTCFADYTFTSDGVTTATGTFTYDPLHPDRIWTMDETGLNPVFHVTGSWTWDADGQLVRVGHDYDDDGVEETTEDLTYDAAGNVLTDVKDMTYSGGLVIYLAYTYTYDAASLRLSASEDWDRDGVPEHTTSYGYDAAGLLVSEEMDVDGDGVTDLWIGHVRDAAGEEVESYEDWGNDGIYEVASTTVYDPYAPGNRTTSTDTDGDDIIDFVETFEVDSAGRLLVYGTDGSPVDGVLNTRTTYVWDPVTGLLASEQYLYNTGSGPLITDYTLTWDAQERLLGQVTEQGSGAPTLEEQWVFGGLCP